VDGGPPASTLVSQLSLKMSRLGFMWDSKDQGALRCAEKAQAPVPPSINPL